MPAGGQPGAVPAQLSLFAIYNPRLGTTDETLHEQIVFYHSVQNGSRSPSKGGHRSTEAQKKAGQENENEKLRQIGLAHGMVSFAKNFSNGDPVDHVQTEKSQVVLHEVETDWWILVRIDLTRLSPGPSTSTASQPNQTSSRREYSSREVAPPHLIRQQLMKAHSIFLLHQAPSLDDLYKRLSRPSFDIIIERFWTRFIRNWDVLLNGNPAVDIFDCIKVAGGGELGFGVGEEEWGSGEREVLEDFVSRTEGLADVVVSRFGNPPPAKPDATQTKKSEENTGGKYSWVGCDTYPAPHDGVVFSGVNTLSRYSLMQVSRWMEWIYRDGKDAYGVGEDPTSTRRRRRRRKASVGRKPDRGRSGSTAKDRSTLNSPSDHSLPPGIPPPLVTGVKHRRTQSLKPDLIGGSNNTARMPTSGNKHDSLDPGTDTFMKILTLGYGSAWGNSSKSQNPEGVNSQSKHSENAADTHKAGDHQAGSPKPPPAESNAARGSGILPLDESPGYFILGLRDDPENDDSDDEDETDQESERRKLKKNKILLRTLHVRLRGRGTGKEGEGPASDHTTEDSYRTLRAAVYLHQPFMFTFLLEPETPVLSSTSFYRSIHHQLGPLQEPLLSSTSPDRIHERLLRTDAYQSSVGNKSPSQQGQIYDVIFDSTNRTLHTSLPNIPEPGLVHLKSAAAQGRSQAQPQPPWNRLDALNVHDQLVNTFIETRRNTSEMERTCKTNRGWWVLWMRLRDRQEADNSKDPTEGQQSAPSSSSAHPPSSQATKEVFLVPKTTDSVPGHKPRVASGGSGFFSNLVGLSTAPNSVTGSAGRHPPGAGAAQFGEAVGFDARRYINGLLSLGR